MFLLFMIFYIASIQLTILYHKKEVLVSDMLDSNLKYCCYVKRGYFSLMMHMPYYKKWTPTPQPLEVRVGYANSYNLFCSIWTWFIPVFSNVQFSCGGGSLYFQLSNKQTKRTPYTEPNISVPTCLSGVSCYCLYEISTFIVMSSTFW